MLDFIRYWFFHYDYSDTTFSTWLLREGFEVYKVDLLVWSHGFHFLLYVACCVVVEINVFLYLADFIDKGGFKLMKQKIIPLICICMVVVLSFPSVPSLADTYQVPGICTQDAVSDYDFGLPLDNWSGGVEGSGYALSHFVKPSDCFPITNETYDSRNFNNLLSAIDSIGIDINDYYYSLSTTYNANLYGVTLYTIPKDSGYFSGADVFGIYSTYNGASTSAGSNGCAFFVQSSEAPSDVTRLPITFYTSTFSNGNWSSWSSTTDYMSRSSVNNEGSIFYYSFSGIGYCNNLLYSNMDYFFLNYAQWDKMYRDNNNNWVVPQMTGTVFANIYFGVNHEYPKGTEGWFNLSNCPYYNGSEVITPSSGEESNENHMYFNSCDFGFCEPYNVNNFTNFGGSYFYVKYNVDNWVLNHIGEYKIEFHVDCYVGNEHFPFTTRVSLDPDLVLTIPFSYFDGFNYGFSTYITDQKIDKSFLKTQLYCIKPEQYTNFYNKLNSVQTTESLHNMLNELADNDYGFPFIFCYTDSDGTTLIKDSILSTNFLNRLYYNNRFTITCNARLIDESGNESGWVSREFDLVRGSSISTNNDGLTNEDPFESDDENEEFLPSLPDNTGSGSVSGSSVVTVNNNMPGKLDVNIDNGFNQFMQTYNSSSEVQTAQNGFWGSFGLFKDNPATKLYSQYFGFLPEGFKEIILGGACIGIIGGAFAALRKKLT